MSLSENLMSRHIAGDHTRIYMAMISENEIKWFFAFTEVNTGFFLAPKKSFDSAVFMAIFGRISSR